MEDYKKLKLKAGLEIHQQLNTHKLFCNCPSILRSDEPQFSVRRKLSPVVGESGVVDTGALYEKMKNKEFEYLVYDTNCLVELDEEPPHEINKDALQIALQIALLMKCKIFPVSQIMRKTIIDGSNTSGFQRTVLIAHDGVVETSEGEVRIESIALEEDSARPESREENLVKYKLDRLGIPLVEITTAPDLKSPEQIKEAALKIGQILRACNVKRGIGTIRQDVNVSIEKGKRIEIKGFQDPKIMLDTIDYEIRRQRTIVELNGKLSKIKLGKFKELTDVFKNTECKFVKSAINNKKILIGFKVENAKGIIGTELQPNKRVGTDLSDYTKSFTGIGGLIHSDENLSKYNFSEEEINQVKEELEIKENDGFILIVGEEKQLSDSYNFIKQRIQMLTTGVPSEVRQSNPDATTSFLRPMSGSARMYPETDCQLLRIMKQQIDFTKNNLPKLASENKRFLQEFGMNEELVMLLLKENRLEDFKELSYSTDYYDLIAKCLVLFPKEIAKKEGIDKKIVISKLNNDLLNTILEQVPEKISPNDVKSVLHKIVQGKSIEDATTRTEIHLSEEIKTIIKEKPNLSKGAYMGLIMNKFSGLLTGKEVNDELDKILTK